MPKPRPQKPKQRVDEFIRREGLDRLIERTQVGVRRHEQYPNLVLLKYHMLDSPMGDPLTHQCRGIILDEEDDWRIVSYPYNKFFNHGEGHAAEIDWSSAKVYEKLDGSLVVLYYYRDQWHMATSGTPDAASPTPYSSKTFRQLFWQTFGEMGYSLPRRENVCYMFELMSPENKIVVPHKENKLVLHGARYVSAKMGYQEIPPEIAAGENGYQCVQTYPAKSFEEAFALVKSLDGAKNEGFVICDRWFNRVKLKNKGYVALHHLKSSINTQRNLMEVVQANEGAELLRYFPEFYEQYWELKDKLRLLCEEAEEVYRQHKNNPSQKEFALAVKDYPYCAALFSTRNGKTTDPTTYFLNMEPKKLLKLIEEK